MNKLLLLLFLLPNVAWAQAIEPVAAPPVTTGTTSGSSNGPAVDRNSNPVIDPTQNVLNLVRALERRLDDIMVLQNKSVDDRFRFREQVINLQADISMAETKHLAEITKLRADYQERLDNRESNRIDAVIAQGQFAAKNEVDRSQKAVDTVASLQTATAETLRSAVASTAAGIATQFSQTTSALVERIAALEKAQYTGQGRSTVADPQVEALRLQVESLSRSSALGIGNSQGVSSVWVLLGGIIVIIISAVGVVIAFVSRRHDAGKTTRR